MQLEKAKETKQDMERCRLLAQRIAEELAPATAAVLNAETPALEKALHRAGVDANPFTVAARQADLLVVEDPAWVEMPAQLPGQVLLVFTGSNVAEGWAEELARRDLGLENSDPEDFSQLQERMEEYMEEFDKNGLNTINIDI